MKSKKDLNLTQGQLRSLIIAILHTPETAAAPQKKVKKLKSISSEESVMESNLSLNKLLYECNQMLMRQFTTGTTDTLQGTLM